MSKYSVISGRMFQQTEVEKAQEWLNANAAIGLKFVSTLPIVEPGHAMYVFKASSDGRSGDETPLAIPAHDAE